MRRPLVLAAGSTSLYADRVAGAATTCRPAETRLPLGKPNAEALVPLLPATRGPGPRRSQPRPAAGPAHAGAELSRSSRWLCPHSLEEQDV